MIRDQRHMSGPFLRATVADVEAFWQEYGARNGFDRGGPMREAVPTRERATVLPAYVSDGRWVADCDECRDGIAAWRDNPRGCCLTCGTIFPIGFPPAEEQAEGEAVLMARDQQFRNWRPDRGETVNDLKAENLVRALPLRAPAEPARPPKEHAPPPSLGMGTPGDGME